MQIDTQYVTWQYEQLLIALLGAFVIEGMDRMRVTVKVEWKNKAVRHNLDLYNDSAVEKLVKRCAERFGLGTAYLTEVFAHLINLLETYRLQELNKLAAKQSIKQLTNEEKRKAEQFLKQPDLLQHTDELIGKCGVIGEENNRLLMYLVFTSRG